MLLSAVSVLVVAQSSSEIPEGLMNNPVYRGMNAKPFTGKMFYAKYGSCHCGDFVYTSIINQFRLSEILRHVVYYSLMTFQNKSLNLHWTLLYPIANSCIHI